MTRRLRLTAVLLSLLGALPALAYVGFVTVAERQDVAVTIYNSEDLTLVRDRRLVVMKPGANALRFQWANTLIDPTSLIPFPPAGVTLLDTTYPLSESETLVWNFKADKQVSGPVAIQYFTSGLTWRADHVVTLDKDAKASVETWIRVQNNSGEDYEDTRFRLVVGEVRLVEKIRDIAMRFRQEAGAYAVPAAAPAREMLMEMERDDMMESKAAMAPAPAMSAARRGPSRAKDVERESLSELHLYSIEGTENVANGASRRMRAFVSKDVTYKDVYRCVDPQNVSPAQRVFSLKNTKDNHMGTQPLPEGTLQLYRETGGALAYDGRGAMPYTPMGEEAETPLGTTPGVYCEAYVKNFKRKNLQKDSLGRTVGWEDVTEHEVKLVNGSLTKVEFELRQHHENLFVANLKGAEKEDATTLLYKTELGAASSKSMTYSVSIKRGTLAQGSR